jgi:predicted HicB family RNase H-like nuclease
MTQLEYKGYQGSVEYSDGVLYIKVLHIADLITAECTDASEVNAEFINLIEEYFEDCREIGKEPERPFKGSFNVRVAPELHRNIALRAEREGISLNQWISWVLEQAVGELVKKRELQAVLKSRHFLASEHILMMSGVMRSRTSEEAHETVEESAAMRIMSAEARIQRH